MHAAELILENGELVDMAIFLEHWPQVFLVQVSRYLADEEFNVARGVARGRGGGHDGGGRGQVLGVGFGGAAGGVPIGAAGRARDQHHWRANR